MVNIHPNELFLKCKDNQKYWFAQIFAHKKSFFPSRPNISTKNERNAKSFVYICSIKSLRHAKT